MRETIQSLGNLNDQDKADICASFERAITETIDDRLRNAFIRFREVAPQATRPALVVAGGVAANQALRTVFAKACDEHGFTLSVPPIHLCTDNAAMIAWAGAERMALGLADDLSAPARPRWPLDQVSLPVYGSGRLGAKA